MDGIILLFIVTKNVIRHNTVITLRDQIMCQLIVNLTYKENKIEMIGYYLCINEKSRTVIMVKSTIE